MADVIQEFRVGLGFRIDESSFKKITDAIAVVKAKATQIVVNVGVNWDDAKQRGLQKSLIEISERAHKLGTEFAAVGAIAVGSLERIAERYAQLFFLSERTGVAAGQLKTMAFAFDTIGGNAATAAQEVATLAARAREMPPGYFQTSIEAVIRSQTGSTEKLKTAKEQQMGLIKMAHQMGEARQAEASAIFKMYGVSYEANIWEIKHYDLTIARDKEAADRRKAMGVDLDRVADIGQEMYYQFKRLWDVVEVTGNKIFQVWGPPLIAVLRTVNWLLNGIIWTVDTLHLQGPIALILGFAAAWWTLTRALRAARVAMAAWAALSRFGAAGAGAAAAGAGAAAAGAGAGAGVAAGAGAAGAGALAATAAKRGLLMRGLGLAARGGSALLRIATGPVGWGLLAAEIAYETGLLDKLFGGSEKGEGTEGPHMQHGGIVPINAHAGEMVLPRNISEGLQDWFTGNDSAAEELQTWLSGAGSVPRVFVDNARELGRELTGGFGTDGGVRTPQEMYGGAPGGGQNRTPQEMYGGAPAGGAQNRTPQEMYGGAPAGGAPVGGAPVGGAPVGGGTAENAFLAEAAKRESGMRNITQKGGGPASGYYQIEDATWRDFAPKLGIDTARAMGASQADQLRVALAILHKQGPGAWTTMRGLTPQSFAPQALGTPLSTGGLGVGGGLTPQAPGTPLSIGGGAPGDASVAQLTKGTAMTPAGAVDTMLNMQGMTDTRHRKTIKDFITAGGGNLDPGALAWCAAVTNAALQLHGIRGTTGPDRNMASSFANWGQGVDPAKAMKGDVALLPPQVRGSSGHVGMVAGTRWRGGKEEIEMIAGNTAHQMMDRWLPVERFAAIRRATEAEQMRQTLTSPQAPSTVNNSGGHTFHVDNRTDIQVAHADDGSHVPAMRHMIERQNADMVRNLGPSIR